MGPRPLVLCALLAALAAAAVPSWADEEILILDNGSVLKGEVVSEEGSTLVLRLDGFRGDARVTIDRARVVQRYQTRGPEGGRTALRPEEEVAAAPTPVATSEPATLPNRWAPAALATEEPAGEPALQSESFIERLARVVEQGMPKDVTGRVTIALLMLLGLLSLVYMGARLAEMETLSLWRAAVLALLLGGFLAADVVWRSELLRADRAMWVLPLQGLAWFGTAVVVLRENPGRALLLFAFVLFSLSVVVFTAGAILMSF